MQEQSQEGLVVDTTLPQALRHKSVVDVHTWADGRVEMSLFGKNGSFSLSLGAGPIPPAVTLYDLYRQPLGNIVLTDDGVFEGWYYEHRGDNPVRRFAVPLSTRFKPSDEKEKRPKPTQPRRPHEKPAKLKKNRKQS